MSTWANKGDLGDAISADTNSISCALDSASGQISRLGEAIPDSLQGEAYDADRRLVNNVCVPALKAQYVALQSMYDGDQSNSGGVSDLPDDPSPLDSDDLSGKIKELDNSIAALQVTQPQDSGSKPSLVETLQKDNGISSGSSGSSSQGSSALDWQISSLQGTRDRLAEALQALMDYDSASSSYYSDADGAIADALSQSCRQMASVRETGEVPSDYPSWGAGLDDLYEKAFANRVEDIRESLLNADGTYNDDRVRHLMNKGDSATSEEIAAAAMAYNDVATAYQKNPNDEEKKTAYEHFIADCYAYARTETDEEGPYPDYSYTVNVYAPTQVFAKAIGVLAAAVTEYNDCIDSDNMPALSSVARAVLGIGDSDRTDQLSYSGNAVNLGMGILVQGEIGHVVGTSSIKYNYNSLVGRDPRSIPLDAAAIDVQYEWIDDGNYPKTTIIIHYLHNDSFFGIDLEDPRSILRDGHDEVRISAYGYFSDSAAAAIFDDQKNVQIQHLNATIQGWISSGISIFLGVSSLELLSEIDSSVSKMRTVNEVLTGIAGQTDGITDSSTDAMRMNDLRSRADKLGITIQVVQVNGVSVVVGQRLDAGELTKYLNVWNKRHKGNEVDVDQVVAYVKKHGLDVADDPDMPGVADQVRRYLANE